MDAGGGKETTTSSEVERALHLENDVTEFWLDKKASTPTSPVTIPTVTIPTDNLMNRQTLQRPIILISLELFIIL